MADLTKEEKRELAKEKKRKERQKEEIQFNLKKFVVIALILGAVGYFGYKIYAFFTAPVPEVAQEPVNVVESDWVKGAQQAEAILIEYGDFQCPACGAYYPMVKQLLDQYPEDLRVIYRHFPLPSHPNAIPAARASEAAGGQGKFWEMHDMLFERQQEWSDLRNPKDRFIEYAEELDLDKEQFVSYYESDEARDAVNADTLSGNKLGVNATPTFYLNGTKLHSMKSYEEFASRIQEVINENGSDGN